MLVFIGLHTENIGIVVSLTKIWNMRCIHYIRNLLLCCTHLRTCEPHSAYVQNVRRKQNIGHMRKMCAGGYAICVQFAHNPQDMCKICAVCAHKKKSTAPVAGHSSKYWAG